MASAEVVAHEPATLAPTVVPESRFHHLDSFLLYGTFSLLFFGPLAFGAVEPWAIFVLSVGATGLLLLWTLRQVLSGCVRVNPNPVFVPILAFGFVVLSQIVLCMSSYQHATVSEAMRYCVYAVFAFLASQLLQRTAQVKKLVILLNTFGCAIALFAILQSLTWNGKLYWVRTPRAGGWVYGPYMNHNHYAGLMEMLLPMALVPALTRMVRGQWKLLSAFAAVLMASTIFLSGSRGGMVAFLVQLVFLGSALRFEKKRRDAVTVAGVLLFIAGLILWAGGQEAVSRIASIHAETRTELDMGTRVQINRDSLRMIANRPLVGWGLGTFAVVYPQFRSFYTNKSVNRAHNDYLQFLVETGGVGFAVAIWFLFALFRGARKKLGDWQWNVNGAVALSALLGCLGILIHGFFDSNLQIPANAALFYVLAAVASADTHFGSHRRIRHHHHGPHPPIHPALSAAPVAGS